LLSILIARYCSIIAPALDTEITTDELIQPLFEVSSQCPHCHANHLKKWGKSGAIQRYSCMGCLKTFNKKTNTPLAKLRKSYLWAEYARCLVLKLTLEPLFYGVTVY